MGVTTADQRAEMYQDLRPLLDPGFLTTRVTVGGHVYALRSLAPRDLYLLAGVARERQPEWRTWAVASSIWMVDGIPLLEDSNLSPRAMFQALNTSHRWVVTSLFAVVANFFLRTRGVGAYLESYLYEEESRRLWYATKNGHVSLSHRSGIPGADRLGLNQIQSSWIAFNRAEDAWHEQEYQWSLTKVQVSLQSSKSSQKLDARDKHRAEAEKSRRLAVHDRAYRSFCGDVNTDGTMANAHGLKIRSVATHDELAEEFRRWVSNDMDDHDRIVEDYKNRVRAMEAARLEDQAMAMQEARERRDQDHLALESSGRSRIVTYTPEEMDRLFPQKTHGGRFIEEDNQGSRLFNRYLRDEQEVHPDALKVPAAADPPYQPSLNEMIAQRRPKAPNGS